MKPFCSFTIRLVFTLIVWSISSSAAAPRLEGTYHNENYEFCVYYPSNWSYDEPFTRNGARFAPKSTKPYVVRPEINVGAHVNQPSEKEDRQQALDEIVEAGIHSLREYGSAKDIRVVRRESLTLEKLAAIASTLRYTDAQSNAERFNKDVSLLTKDGIVYFLELKCNPKDAAQLEPLFDAIVRSLRLGCTA